MTSDPAPSYPSDPPAPSGPPTQASPAYDPWAPSPDVPQPPAAFPAPPAAFPAAPAQQTPPTAPLPATPPPAAPADPSTPSAAGQYPTPPAPFSGPPAQFSAPPAQFSAPPAQFSAPPAQFSTPPAPFPAPAGVDPYAAPVGQPGPYPPQFTPPLPGAAGGQQPAAVQIGEIMVNPPMIHTPAGVLPLAGATWYVTDHWQREEKIASWAIVCAILGFFCLTIFSLLFLLIKETRYHGTVQVTVTSGGHQYVARIPVVDQGQVQQINNQVNYARSLSVV
ncbi:hypothetical protein B5D80_26040 [Micromonospora wenchangensis]|uniref:Uncharacterized protein n=1 Tax=Micromonospora wenchangensis TaxID=1185415 RepID=A0A246RFF2_9ACTN|nr:hypothetical protein [Micromonospora wenchangensis]OWV01575.1 hypothetical protein B5D80_26040 [Micromonospora wenchangensis]